MILVNDILRAAAASVDLSVPALLERRPSSLKHRPAHRALHRAMLLARRHRSDLSYPVLGRLMHRDHTAVLHGVRSCMWRVVSGDEDEVQAVDALEMRVALTAAARQDHPLARLFHERRQLVDEQLRLAGRIAEIDVLLRRWDEEATDGSPA